ncbi:hypothetical protein GW796_06205 [archaeon]|nr:hypothetical protein [archaeon]
MKNKEKKENKTLGFNLTIQENLMKRMNEASLNNNLTKAAYLRLALEDKLKKDGY